MGKGTALSLIDVWCFAKMKSSTACEKVSIRTQQEVDANGDALGHLKSNVH